MDKERFRECLAALHWPSATVAEVLKIPLSVSMEWLLGRSEVPPNVALWLEALTRAHTEAPLPTFEPSPGEQDIPPSQNETETSESEIADPPDTA